MATGFDAATGKRLTKTRKELEEEIIEDGIFTREERRLLLKEVTDNYNAFMQEPRGIVEEVRNPKDAIGIRKVPMSSVPATAILEAALGMLEGNRKHGRHNYRRAKVVASVYYDAAMRHLMAWWEGENTDPISDIHHVSKTISDLLVLRDAMINDMCIDDRPPKVKDQEWIDKLNERAAKIIDKFPNPKKPALETDNG